MKLYLVRHGESKLNAARIHQDGQVGLSEDGVKQANQVAERMSSVPVDIILSSPFERAKHTAEVIGRRINRPIEINPLLVELKRPTEIVGKRWDEPAVVGIKNRILENWHDSAFRHSNEETFYEFKDRARQVIELVSQFDKKHVLVVTHGNFIRMLVGFMIFGEGLKPDEVRKFFEILVLSNTGITVCDFENGQWKLITWNDVSHIPA